MMKKRAFTLIELIIGIVIIGVMAGAMIPMLAPQLDKYRLNTAGQILLFDLRQAQQFAMAREGGFGYYGVQFYNSLGSSNNQDGYKILRYEPEEPSLPIPAHPNDRSKAMKSPVASDNAELFEDNMIFDKRVRIDPSGKITSSGRIIFTPEGSATSDGSTLLTSNNNQITLVCGNLKNTITIKPVTGYSEIQ